MADRRQLLVLGGLTAAALALRLIHLTRFELFVDEAATWWFAKLIASGGLSEQMSLEPTPPLYYGLVGVLMRLFGETDAVLRWPSAFFGAAAVPLVFGLAQAIFSRRVGWIAAILIAVHPLHVFYSREARVYPLLLCLTLLTLWALWRALEIDTTHQWCLFTLALLAVCYSHFYGLFLGFSSVLAILAWSRDGHARWRGLLAAAIALLLFAPYLWMTLPHLKESGAAWSINTFYRDLPEEKRLGRVLEAQLIGADYHPYLRQLDRPPTPELLRTLSLLAQLALLAAALRAAVVHERLRELGFVAVFWLVPVLVPWTITGLGRAIFHAGRHDVYVLGALCVLLAVGLDNLLKPGSIRRRALATVVILGIATGAVFRLAALHRASANPSHRSAGAWIASQAEPQDRVLAMGIRRLVTEHYARLDGSQVAFESFPASTDGHPGWSDVMTLIEDQDALHREAREKVELLEREMSVGDTLFLLLRPYERQADKLSATWLVDRHVLENLWHSGWRRIPEAGSEAAHIQAYLPPLPTSSEHSKPAGRKED